MVARSSVEAEFWSIAHGICELLWIQGLLRELGFVSPRLKSLYYDNKAVISITHNSVQHDRTKHIEVDKHFIKEKLHTGQIWTPIVKIENQLADLFIKDLNGPGFGKIIGKLGMSDIYIPTWVEV